ncbi:hypothetical protein CHS0354_001203 [Potamilus streckersoni]|uniref:Uncharacterized protein n=1 Tax=Potamilus streckersoni TaxID=2493646 RepID=A0AAE0RMK8_9BIVA|nr:hypothetical protein CHS0354_001203 [Potamilus streckersoni]
MLHQDKPMSSTIDVIRGIAYLVTMCLGVTGIAISITVGETFVDIAIKTVSLVTGAPRKIVSVGLLNSAVTADDCIVVLAELNNFSDKSEWMQQISKDNHSYYPD